MNPRVVLLAAGLAVACTTPQSKSAIERVTIPSGAPLRAVADSLGARGIVRSPAWFRLLARLRFSERRLKAGVYDLPRDLGAWNALTALEAGRVATVRFTVPEGLSLTDLAALVGEQLGLDRDSLLAAAGDPRWRERLGITRGDLEGFLRPETYTLTRPVTAGSVIAAMARGFEEGWRPAWNARLDSLRLTRAEVVTLASIVEAEARDPAERPVIAGVYHNRLRRGMLLQADPTVQYALQLASGQRKPRLYFKDLAITSPYNTYLHPGLPPGPINSPGTASIQAALYPANVPWLYFVAGDSGRHVFSRTLRDHNNAIAALRRARTR